MSGNSFSLRSRNFWAGVILAFFVIIGFFTVCGWLKSLSQNVVNRQWEKKRMINLIEPVLICDPVPFSLDSLPDNNLLLQSALNNIFLNPKKEYAKSEEGEFIIPQSDVEVSVNELFGTGPKLEHRSLRDLSDFYCVYHEGEAAYYVQYATQMSTYLPSISDIEREGDLFSLKVGYIRPRVLAVRNEKGEIEPDKYMIYKLQKSKSRHKYIILAIEEITN